MRLLVPWYRFPPYDSQKVGGLSVAVWGLTHGLRKCGVDVHVEVPPFDIGPTPRPADGVTVASSELGQKLLEGKRLSAEERSSLDSYDRILSIHNFASRSLSGIGLGERLVRQLHTVLTAQPLSYNIPLKCGLADYLRAFVSKKTYESAERRLRGTRTICVSELLRSQLLELKLENPENIKVVPLGVDTRVFCPMKRENQYDFLFVGGYWNAKGLDLLLKAYGLMNGSGFPRLGIVGRFNDSERNTLLRLVPRDARHGIQFLGTVPNDGMPEVYNSSRYVVVPSRFETFCIVALEAMACGVPILASRAGALPELVDGNTGEFLDFGNHGLAANQLQKILSDEELPARVRDASPPKAKQYDWKSVSLSFAENLE